MAKTDPKREELSDVGLKKDAEVGSAVKMDAGARDAFNTPDSARVIRILDARSINVGTRKSVTNRCYLEGCWCILIIVVCQSSLTGGLDCVVCQRTTSLGPAVLNCCISEAIQMIGEQHKTTGPSTIIIPSKRRQ
jgi:hypothetical protein